MFTDFNKIYYLEIDLKNLEVTYNSKALYANIDLDTSAMLIRLTLDEKPLDITGKIVTAYIKTSKDQNVTMQKCEILESNEGIIGLDFKNSALKAGTNVFFLEIKSENREIINSPLISYKVVEHFDIASGTEGENDITILRQLITEVDISKASVEALRDEVIEQETKREKAEADRKDNENSRAESENSRVQAETARATGEIAREQAESIREGNEVIRVNSESLRESSENARQQEEIKRSQSEALRVEAEEEREISYEEIKNDNSTFKEEINTIVNNYKEETDNVIDEYKTDIDETMSELDEKFGNAKVDYFGEEHLDVVDRLNSDFDNVHQRINDSSYLEYSGSNITADNTYYGLTKDLSIKGRTLQNLLKTKPENTILNSSTHSGYMQTTFELSKKVYSFIFDVTSFDGAGAWYFIRGTGSNTPFVEYSRTHVTSIGKYILKVDLSEKDCYQILCGFSGEGSGSLENVILLEGDYTNTPIEELLYGEGIYSVGENEVTEDGKYPVKVRSCGKNLAKNRKVMDMQHSTGRYVTNDNGGYTNPTSIEYLPKGTYVLSLENYNVANFVDTHIYIWKTDLSIKNCRKVEISKAFEILGGEVGVTWYGAVAENENIDKLINMRVQIEEGTVATEFEPYQESIQEFQLTEPLRSLPNGVADEILEDGKLIRRVGKLILNGTENWTGFKNHFEDFDEFSGNIGNYKILQSNSIVNNFPQTNNHRIVTAGNTTYIRLPKGNVNNLNECKQWLSQNPTIVYYELAEPVVTKHNKSPNLKTFDGITHITSDNYLLPTISCKVPSNVQAVVTSLMKENKRLNSTISLMSLENEEIKKVNETQDELIDVSLCATDEIFMMIEPLLINTHSLSRKGENPIVNMYVAMVNRGLKNIEEVPNIYREQVKEIIG